MRNLVRGALFQQRLPVRDHFEWSFVEQLRTRAEFATVPIIVHTSERLEAHLNDLEKVVAPDLCVRDSGVVVCDRDDE